MKLLDLLREQGVTPWRTIKAVPTACETLLEQYRCYLRDERALAEGSIRNMMPLVNRFLAQKYPRDHFEAPFFPIPTASLGIVSSGCGPSPESLNSSLVRHSTHADYRPVQRVRNREDRHTCSE
jgi:hypothetical protein